MAAHIIEHVGKTHNVKQLWEDKLYSVQRHLIYTGPISLIAASGELALIPNSTHSASFRTLAS